MILIIIAVSRVMSLALPKIKQSRRYVIKQQSTVNITQHLFSKLYILNFKMKAFIYSPLNLIL